MYSEAKKLHIIEEILKIEDESVLIALEDFMDKSKKAEPAPLASGFEAFVGIWSADEADEIQKIIADSCETINPDDWK